MSDRDATEGAVGGPGGPVDARYPDVDGERHHTFLFAIDDDVVVDAAVNGNAAGEELAYDYALELPERHTPAAKRKYPCHCGAVTCRGTMLAKKR